MQQSPTEIEILKIRCAKTFLALSEKVTKIVGRLDAIEEMLSKSKQSESELNVQERLSKDPNMIDQFKDLKEVVYANKEI